MRAAADDRRRAEMTHDEHPKGSGARSCEIRATGHDEAGLAALAGESASAIPRWPPG